MSGRDRPSTWRGTAILVGLLALACTSPSVSSQPQATAIAGTAATLGAPTPTPTVALHELPSEFRAGTALRSIGTELVWSQGAESDANLLRYRPGTNAPELVFENPLSDSQIDTIVGSAAGYAFTERNDSQYQPGNWKIWYLPRGAPHPVELDAGFSRNNTPTIAMNDRYVVWAALDAPDETSSQDWPDVAISRVRMIDIERPSETITLAESHVREAVAWYPFLNGDELWYGVVHGDFELGVQDEYHLVSVALQLGGTPLPWTGIGREFNPLASDVSVFFRRAAPGFSPLNWGELMMVDRTTMSATTIAQDAGVSSMGSRFVTFEEISYSQVRVFDLAEGSLKSLVTYPSSGQVHVGGESIAGNLLTFFQQVDGEMPTISWALLPE